MEKTLRKRLLRNLKKSFGRYLALTLLIVLGIYLVLSIVGAAETIIKGTESKREVNMVENGQFNVFLPLKDEEISELSENGTVIEEMFYTDISLQDNSILRMFKNREKVNLVQLDNGRLAENIGEVVLEKRYAEEHDIKVGDTIDIGGVELSIVGIGTAPDYDKPVADFSDSAVESSSFGLMFVTNQQYEDIVNELSLNAEEYVYAYRLGDSMTNNELKDEIKKLEFDYTKVENEYYKETIDNALSERYEIEEDIADLDDGAKLLYSGLNDLNNNSEELTDVSNKLFDYYISQVNAQLLLRYSNVNLTRDNYASVLASLVETDTTGNIAEYKESLDELKDFCDGIKDYTDGVDDATAGSKDLYKGVDNFKKKANDILDEAFNIDLNNLTEFTVAEDNVRIESAAEDVVTNKSTGLLAGIIILILFSYVISVFVIHQIEQELSVIGALYALGVKKRELLHHYIILPTIVALVGGVIGTILAYTPIGAKNQMASTYSYFSLPEFDVEFPAYLVIYGLVLPPVIAAIVNMIVINKKLSQTALSLIRNEHKVSNYHKVKLKSKKFTRIFKIRQLVREYRSGLTIVLGMLLSLMLLMLGLDCYVMCNSVKVNNVEDTKYNYMYLYKYADQTVPEGGEGAFIKNLSIDCMGNTLDATVIGIVDDSKYFDAKPEKGKSKVVVNNSMVERYGLKDGDIVTLTDSVEEMDYAFTVTDDVQYAPGFTLFMNIDSMRELFDEDDDYFNVVYSDEKLDIESGKLYSVTTKEDIEKSSAVFIDVMMTLIVVLIAAGIVIFCIVMYLMMGVMIDRSSYGISLMKIFGYRANEIRKLYLDGYAVIIAIGGLIGIPLSKMLMDIIWPYFVTNLACSMDLSFPWYLYLAIYAGLLLVYFVIRKFMIRKIQKVTPAEILKNRE